MSVSKEAHLEQLCVMWHKVQVIKAQVVSRNSKTWIDNQGWLCLHLGNKSKIPASQTRNFKNSRQRQIQREVFATRHPSTFPLHPTGKYPIIRTRGRCLSPSILWLTSGGKKNSRFGVQIWVEVDFQVNCDTKLRENESRQKFHLIQHQPFLFVIIQKHSNQVDVYFFTTIVDNYTYVHHPFVMWKMNPNWTYRKID